jgi:hypothetical protein
MLLGCDVPLILRPCPDDEWVIVDACHVHSMMNGKALLGRLPDNINLVRHLAPVGRYFVSFRNRKTGEIGRHDARASALSSTWNVATHEMQEYYMYVNDETGEIWLDPWLSEGMLRERGVPVRTFKLV